jgi:uncharacterized membrane protein
LFRAFLDQWPSYLAYVVSFATIGSAWLAHSAITEYLDRVDAGLVRLNLLLLLVVSFLPFPTRLLAEYIGEPDPERVAATIYDINLLVVAVLVWVLWRYACVSGWCARTRTTSRCRYSLSGSPPGSPATW